MVEMAFVGTAFGSYVRYSHRKRATSFASPPLAKIGVFLKSGETSILEVLSPSPLTLSTYPKPEETSILEVLSPSPPAHCAYPKPEETNILEDHPPTPRWCDSPNKKRTYEVLPKKVKKSVSFDLERNEAREAHRWIGPLIHKHWKAKDAHQRVYDDDDEDIVMFDVFRVYHPRLPPPPFSFCMWWAP